MPIFGLGHILPVGSYTFGAVSRYSGINFATHNKFAATQTALNKYKQDPSLLQLVCETDLHSIVIQTAMADPLSYHAGEDLNPYAGEVGVVLIADQAADHQFIITENAISYLTYLFSDPKILATAKLAVNSAWLDYSDDNDDIRAMWLDVIEVQALHHAKISIFEFKMYWQNIVHILDRRRPGSSSMRNIDFLAIDAVNSLLNTVEFRITNDDITYNKASVIEARLKQIYAKHTTKIAQFKLALADSKLDKMFRTNSNKFSL